MIISNYDNAQGHWILASMGKRVLRPGGKELTLKLIDSLSVTEADDVVEFAPGIGFTAAITIAKRPNSYVAVDAEEDIVNNLTRKLANEKVSFVHTNAASTGLPADSKTKVYGEAVLTMQSDPRKAEIIAEAYRILKKGGLYAIHEISLAPVSLTTKEKQAILKDLTQAIKVNARPLTEDEWRSLLEEAGFKVKKVETNGMLLLEIKRMIDDEGFFRFLKIACNILRNKAARKRILAMRRTFKKHKENMRAIMILAQK